ncbi:MULTISPECIES: hypothetical protein [unclassified Moorena]|uniref:hypothetical protein n=1 Tax=unclassified Moorena TaxID=2683338 RepID=UPI0025804710|nr:MULTISPECIES: hypothetical protein [unclassified Moorena]
MQVDRHGSNFRQFDLKSVDRIRLELRKHKRTILARLFESRKSKPSVLQDALNDLSSRFKASCQTWE